MLTTLYYGDFTACYLATCNGVDPTLVSPTDYMKEQLGRSLVYDLYADS